MYEKFADEFEENWLKCSASDSRNDEVKLPIEHANLEVQSNLDGAHFQIFQV